MRGALRQEMCGQKPLLRCDGRRWRGQKRDTDRSVGLDLENLVDEVRQGLEVIERLVEKLDLKEPGNIWHDDNQSAVNIQSAVQLQEVEAVVRDKEIIATLNDRHQVPVTVAAEPKVRNVFSEIAPFAPPMSQSNGQTLVDQQVNHCQADLTGSANLQVGPNSLSAQFSTA